MGPTACTGRNRKLVLGTPAVGSSAGSKPASSAASATASRSGRLPSTLRKTSNSSPRPRPLLQRPASAMASTRRPASRSRTLRMATMNWCLVRPSRPLAPTSAASAAASSVLMEAWPSQPKRLCRFRASTRPQVPDCPSSNLAKALCNCCASRQVKPSRARSSSRARWHSPRIRRWAPRTSTSLATSCTACSETLMPHAASRPPSSEAAMPPPATGSQRRKASARACACRASQARVNLLNSPRSRVL
mmetsp:Transcript_54713/g.175504  ORF Transcript_54713/g.175504 Transcript_54713/m.175504 type:complete len:247 (+) Transcript_54713:1270-2010(+)